MFDLATRIDYGYITFKGLVQNIQYDIILSNVNASRSTLSITLLFYLELYKLLGLIYKSFLKEYIPYVVNALCRWHIVAQRSYDNSLIFLIKKYD